MRRSRTQAPAEPEGDADSLMSMDQLVAALRVDRADLDSELVNHANLFWHVSAQHDFAQKAAEEAKAHADQVEAQARLYLSGDDSVKRTVAQVNVEVNTDKGVVQARKYLAELKHEQTRWASLREAHRQRGQMLRALTELYTTNYYQTGIDQTRARGSYSDARYERGKEAIRRDHAERTDSPAASGRRRINDDRDH